ncbi:DNA polymerase [Bacillus sp. CB28A.1]
MKMAVYIQQELRWLAIVTQEPVLIEAFKKGLDVHSQITCQIKGLLITCLRIFEIIKEKH